MYILFVDDKRNPYKVMSVEDLVNADQVLVARGVRQACHIFERHGLPLKMYLDHDLGGDERIMEFLKYVAATYPYPVPKWFSYVVISSNPVGRDNIISFMESWKKASRG